MNSVTRKLIALSLIFGVFVAGNFNYRFFHRRWIAVKSSQSERSDRKVFCALNAEAQHFLFSAFSAEQNMMCDEAIRLYDEASKKYTSIIATVNYKKCVILFSEHKYSQALDCFTQLIKLCDHNGLHEFYLNIDVLGRVYVCLYDECGSEEATEWLKESTSQLDENEKNWAFTLLARSADMASSDASRSLGGSNENKMQILLKCLEEIDQKKSKERGIGEKGSL